MAYIKFANQQKLKKHVETVHEGIKSFKCSVCDPYELLSGYFMQKHTKKVSKDPKQYYTCINFLPMFQLIQINRVS